MMRKWFGPTRTEIMQCLSQDAEGQFVSGSFWKEPKVHIAHDVWEITVDIYLVSTGKAYIEYTRLRAPFLNPDRFRFKVKRRGALYALGRLFGLEKIDVGFADFDDHFVLKGNDAAGLRKLFADARLRELLSAQPAGELGVYDDEGFFGPKYGADEDKLQFMVTGKISDLTRLRSMVDLMAHALDRLYELGVTPRRATQAKL